MQCRNNGRKFRSDRTNLYLLFCQGGYKEDMKIALHWASQTMPDSVVMWESAASWEETQTGLNSFLLSLDRKNGILRPLPDKSRSLRGTTRHGMFDDLIPQSLVCRWNGIDGGFFDEYVDVKELMINTFDEINCPNYQPEIYDLLVIYLKPGEEVFWKLCSASLIPGDALTVDKSAQGELLFLGYKEGEEYIGERLGYVRAGKGLMHHHVESTGYRGGQETMWEVREGFWVLCAREKMFF